MKMGQRNKITAYEENCCRNSGNFLREKRWGSRKCHPIFIVRVVMW
jgi:hypothetical protein